MSTPLIPQEIFLLERFCAPERFERMRDAWAATVSHAEEMLDRFMRQLPPDYRNRPLWNQPDRVWGERVLPNFRNTLDDLNASYIGLMHGDLAQLGAAEGIEGDLRGQNMDYPPDWMDEVEHGSAVRYGRLAGVASSLAGPIAITSRRGWAQGDLTVDYDEVVHEALNLPSNWPKHELNNRVTLKSGDRVKQSGIYMPDVDNAAPQLQFLATNLLGKASQALVYGPADGDGDRRLLDVPCTWTLVERIADSGGGVPKEYSEENINDRLRCDAGQPCPKTGYWFTPARTSSRRHFRHGEVMPSIVSDYGATIWQWHPNQSD